MKEIFILYLHIHKAEHFTFKIVFIHNISAQLCLLWTLPEFHFTHLFQTQNKVFSSFQTKLRMKVLLCHPGDAETATQVRGQWVGLTGNHCSLSNHHSTEIRGNDEICLFKKENQLFNFDQMEHQQTVPVKAALRFLPHNRHKFSYLI